MTEGKKYRVFISYSREDSDLVEKIVEILEENGLHPMHDKGFGPGEGFPGQIKNYIAHSHVFMPVITKESSKRGWVHQEIGYAMALNIPVLPISYGEDPGQMIRDLQAFRWEDSEKGLEKNRGRLSLKVFESIIRRAQSDSPPLFECAELQEDRTKLIVDYARKVIDLESYGHVRQKGALSSFHIPDKPITHSVWKERYGSFEINEYRCRLQREERIVLEEHAREEGCSIIIDPYLTYGTYGADARKSRLNELLLFLNSMPPEKVRVAVQKNMPKAHNIIIVGNWFAAEAVSAAVGKGYQQTIFTRHAPTIQAKIELFDREFEELLKTQGITSEDSLNYTIKFLKGILSDL
jgi:hypothetical protein